jgi:hypothetical protein
MQTFYSGLLGRNTITSLDALIVIVIILHEQVFTYKCLEKNQSRYIDNVTAITENDLSARETLTHRRL